MGGKKEKPVPTLTLDTKPVQHLKDDVEYIKIHGLQRTGTNWLTFLINENFQNTKVLVNTGGWKHGPWMVPWIMGREIHTLTVVKNPYAWLVSVYNYWGPNRKLNIGPDLTGVPFSDFIKNRMISEKQKSIPFLLRAKNPIQHWNNMNFHWSSLRMKEKFSIIITYETLIADLNLSLQNLEKTFQLKRKFEDKWMNSENVFVPGGEDVATNEATFRPDYYKNQEWLHYYTPELIEFVNNEIDLDLMIHYGYKLLKPEMAANK